MQQSPSLHPWVECSALLRTAALNGLHTRWLRAEQLGRAQLTLAAQAAVLQAEGASGAAAHVLRRVLELEPDNTRAHFALGQVLPRSALVGSRSAPEQ